MPHFPQRTAVHGGGEFFGDARGLRHAPSHEPRDKVRAALEHEIFPLRRDGRFEIADAGIELLQADCLGRLRVPQCVHLGRIQARRKDDLVGVEPPGKVLLQFLRRRENLLPPFVLPLEARAEILHLVLVSRCRIPGRAASDIRASRRARAKRDMDVKVVRVVMNPVGVANRVRRMKPLVELPHDLLRRGLQHAVGIDSGFDQLVVQSRATSRKRGDAE